MHRESCWNADADRKAIWPMSSSWAVFKAFFSVVFGETHWGNGCRAWPAVLRQRGDTGGERAVQPARHIPQPVTAGNCGPQWLLPQANRAYACSWDVRAHSAWLDVRLRFLLLWTLAVPDNSR